MSAPDQDYLWDRRGPADPEIAALERLLAGHGALARGVLQRSLPAFPLPPPRRRRRWLILPPALAAAALLLLLGHHWRLSWPEDQAWALQLWRDAGRVEHTVLASGEALELAEGEQARIRVARIGELSLAPGSRVRLLHTGAAGHRFALEQGRLQARIWAPPGYFEVRGAGARIIDFGCEFDLAIDADGRGRLEVLSGWVGHFLGAQDILVPAGHALRFDPSGGRTPVRMAAADTLHAAIEGLDEALAEAATGDRIATLAGQVANHAEDADFHSLLSLLTRNPHLAESALYPRLAQVLGSADDGPQHRQHWAAGDRAAINLWWSRVPVPPKQWWRHWRDALP